jgi:hypothetical protein
VSGQLHAVAALSPRERAPGTYWIIGWVGPREKSLAPAGNRTPAVHPVAIPTELSRLSYETEMQPGSYFRHQRKTQLSRPANIVT